MKNHFPTLLLLLLSLSISAQSSPYQLKSDIPYYSETITAADSYMDMAIIWLLLPYPC